MLLAFREEWPLWTVEKKIYGEQVWVELDNVPDLQDNPNALDRLAEQLSLLEHVLIGDGIYGWIASVQHENRSMNRLLLMIGATPYAKDEEFQYYRKFAGVPEIPPNAMGIFRQQRRGGLLCATS